MTVCTVLLVPGLWLLHTGKRVCLLLVTPSLGPRQTGQLSVGFASGSPCDLQLFASPFQPLNLSGFQSILVQALLYPEAQRISQAGRE